MNRTYCYKVEENDPEVFIQLPKALLQDLKRVAKEQGRTLNTEILARLNRTFQESYNTEEDPLNLIFR